MKKLTIFVGSVLGGTEFVADQLAEQAQLAGYQVEQLLDFELFEATPQHGNLWFICTSTHGAGDVPDNLQPFSNWLSTEPDLSQIRFGLMGIGDSSYDTFCNAAKTIQSRLLACHAQQIEHTKLIDVQLDPLPEDPALEWFQDWLQQV